MSSFKKADGIIDSIQKQATGLRTLDGSAIEDFLSIAGYEDPAGGGGAMIVTSSQVNGVHTMDKTVQEIYDALMSGTPVYYKYQSGTIGEDYITNAWLAPITYVYTYEVTNVIRVVVNRPFCQGAGASGSSGDNLLSPSVMIFEASTLNGYPTFYRTVGATFNTTYSSASFMVN